MGARTRKLRIAGIIVGFATVGLGACSSVVDEPEVKLDGISIGALLKVVGLQVSPSIVLCDHDRTSAQLSAKAGQVSRWPASVDPTGRYDSVPASI